MASVEEEVEGEIIVERGGKGREGKGRRKLSFESRREG